MDQAGIFKKIAHKYELNESQVEDLVEYMWHLVIRCFNDDRMPTVKLDGLCTWKVQPSKLKRLLNKMDDPDWKYYNKENKEEYRKSIQEIYTRRLTEEYLNGLVTKIPKSVKEDVEQLRKHGKIFD